MDLFYSWLCVIKFSLRYDVHCFIFIESEKFIQLFNPFFKFLEIINIYIKIFNLLI